MGRALELITGFATAPGATITEVTMAAGNSATVRNADLASEVLLLQAWACVQGAGVLRIRSPKLHDAVQGIRFDNVVSEAKPLMPGMHKQPLVPQDDLTIELSGSAAAGDIEQCSLLLYYGKLPGADARLISPDLLMERMVNLVTVENTLTLGAAGGYSGEEAINTEFDQLKANVDYALLGYVVDAECCSVRWRGADTGNMGVGGPGDELGRDYTRDWFIMLSRLHNLPLIPVFNAANKGGILIDGATDENAAAVTVTSIFGELAPGTIPGGA